MTLYSIYTYISIYFYIISYWQGFEPWGTEIAKRYSTWERLLDSTSTDGSLSASEYYNPVVNKNLGSEQDQFIPLESPNEGKLDRVTGNHDNQSEKVLHTAYQNEDDDSESDQGDEAPFFCHSSPSEYYLNYITIIIICLLHLPKSWLGTFTVASYQTMTGYGLLFEDL